MELFLFNIEPEGYPAKFVNLAHLESFMDYRGHMPEFRTIVIMHSGTEHYSHYTSAELDYALRNIKWRYTT